MKRRKSNPTFIIVFILIAIALIIANTYARYNKKFTGDGSAYVAKWSFKANGFGISRTDYVTSSQIMEGKLAPGTSGTITVDIDVTDCDVAVDYLIILHTFDGKPTHLIIRGEDGEALEYDSENDRYTVEGSILVTEQDGLKDENDNVIKHVRLPFEWPYETVPTEGVAQSALDEIDTNEGKTIEEMSFYITVIGIQQGQENKVTLSTVITGEEAEPQTITKTVKLDNKQEGVIETEIDATGSTTAVDYTITLSNVRNGLENTTFRDENGTTLTEDNGTYKVTGTISLEEIQTGNAKKIVKIYYTGTNENTQGKLNAYNGERILLVANSNLINVDNINTNLIANVVGATSSRQQIKTIRTIADADDPMFIDVEIIAEEAEFSYTITYSLDGGINNSDNPESYTNQTPDITLKPPTKENYVFIGWTYSGQTTPQLEVTIARGSTEDLLFTANWEAKNKIMSNTDNALTNLLANDESATFILNNYISDICSSETAMTAVGNSANAVDIIKESESICNSINNSPYWKKVYKKCIPIMTSNTAPRGVASAINTSANSAYYAFNGCANLTGGNADSYVWCANKNNSYVQYMFADDGIIPKKVEFANANDNGYGTTSSGYVSAGTSTSDLTNIVPFTNLAAAVDHYLNVPFTTNKYKYFRCYLTKENSTFSNANKYRIYIFNVYGL